MVGQTISHYRILDKLGEGGMGVVYKAEDLKLKRIVALKFLTHGLDSHEPDQARFLREAQVASALNHPNVCTIHDIVQEQQKQFIVMEYVDGVLLREKISHKDGEPSCLQMDDVVSYAVQIGQALVEAHSKGIVHRDIKSSNIMVNSKNQIKVMDFGLAKLKGSMKLTKTLGTVGTLAYMAPEQIRGAEADTRSDIFSFGVVLYEMITGELPFRGEHEAAMIYSILSERPEPIESYRTEVSTDLKEIVDRALQKDPRLRYQSANEMVLDLQRLKMVNPQISRSTSALRVGKGKVKSASGGQTVPASGLKRGRRNVLLLGGIAVIFALVAMIVTFIVVPNRAPRLSSNPNIRTLEIPLSQISYPSLSRDGNWAAFSARGSDDEWSVYFMNVAKGEPKRLTAEVFQGVGYAEISPDGGEVLYDRVPPGGINGTYLVSSTGGAGRRIAEPATGGRWRPDGKLIGYIRYGGPDVPSRSGLREFWTVKPDGSENRIEFVDSLSYLWGNYCFDWSPKGTSIAWLRSFPGYDEIFIRDLGSRKERQLTAIKKPITEIAWGSNDQIFFSSSKGGSTNIWMIPADGGEAVQVTKGSGPDLAVRVSAGAKRLLYLEQQTVDHIWSADIDGRNMRQLTFDNRTVGLPTFSPNGQQITFSMSSADLLRPGSQIFIMQSNGEDRTQLTAGDGLYFNATWSPDGRYIAYGIRKIGEPSDSARIYLRDVTNPGEPMLVGKAMYAWWIDNSRFLSVLPLPSIRSALYSLPDLKLIETSSDSTWQFPLRDGKGTIVDDLRKGREGWWLISGERSHHTAPKQILSSEYTYSAWPSVSLRYLIYLKSNGEVWRIYLPDGKQERLPQIFDGLNPWAGYVQLSFDDKHAVFLKERFDSRLVLIDNLSE